MKTDQIAKSLAFILAPPHCRHNTSGIVCVTRLECLDPLKITSAIDHYHPPEIISIRQISMMFPSASTIFSSASAIFPSADLNRSIRRCPQGPEEGQHPQIPHRVVLPVDMFMIRQSQLICVESPTALFFRNQSGFLQSFAIHFFSFFFFSHLMDQSKQSR